MDTCTFEGRFGEIFSILTVLLLIPSSTGPSLLLNPWVLGFYTDLDLENR